MEDKIEINMSVNYFGFFLFINFFFELLKKLLLSRIIFVFFVLYKYGIVDFENFQNQQKKSYVDSKFVNVYFAREFVERLKNIEVVVYIIYFGMVNIELLRYFVSQVLNFIVNFIKFFLFFFVIEGSEGIVYFAIVNLGKDIGKYYGKIGQEEKWFDIFVDIVVWKKLWDVSEKIINLNF